jgi:hypothetical protein
MKLNVILTKYFFEVEAYQVECWGETARIVSTEGPVTVSFVNRNDDFRDLVIKGPNTKEYILPVGFRDNFWVTEEGIAHSIISVTDPDRARSPHWKYEDWWTIDLASEF